MLLPVLLQDLEEEGLAVRVGSLAVRWVLMEHAEPWLLTVSSKHGVQTEASRSTDPERAGCSRSKRCRRYTTRQSGELPEKRTWKDGREDDGEEEPSRGEEERINREQEHEKVPSTLEKGGELQLPEAAGKPEGTEAREQQQQPPAEEAPESSSAPTQAADADGG